MLTKKVPTRKPSQLPTLVISNIGPEKFTVMLIGALEQKGYKYAYALIVDKNKRNNLSTRDTIKKRPYLCDLRCY